MFSLRMRLSSCGFVGESRGEFSFNISKDRPTLVAALEVLRGLTSVVSYTGGGPVDDLIDVIDSERPWAIEWQCCEDSTLFCRYGPWFPVIEYRCWCPSPSLDTSQILSGGSREAQQDVLHVPGSYLG